MAKSKSKNYTPKQLNRSTVEQEAVVIPDEAINYIVSHYLQRRNRGDGIPAVIGISSNVVEDVLQLLVDWASITGKVEGGVLKIGTEE